MELWNGATREDLAWVSGIFEGEGTVSAARSANGRRVHLQLRVGMTDVDIIRRLHSITGMGTVTGPYQHGPAHCKPRWVWSVQSNVVVYALTVAMWSWLGERRRGQVRNALSRWVKDGLPITPEEAFWCNVDTSGDCWVWTSYVPASGRARVRVGDRTIPAQERSMELATGAIPARAMSTCGTLDCLRPDHLVDPGPGCIECGGGTGTHALRCGGCTAKERWRRKRAA